MHFKNILAIALLSGIAFSSNAQTTIETAKPVSTIKNDNQRIKEGVKSGELTKPEAARLANQTAKLKNERQAYKADGVVTTGERIDFRKHKKRVSKNIYRQKHDRQIRR